MQHQSFQNATLSAAKASAIIFVTASLTSIASAANDPIDFRPSAQAGSFRQAKVIVEVEGKLKLNADGKEPKHLPLKVQGELHYFERVLRKPSNGPTFACSAPINQPRQKSACMNPI